jgi:hypothetical protein
VTALKTGEVNRPDGIADLVVGVQTSNDFQVLVFDSPRGVLSAQPESYSMPARVNSVALAQSGPNVTSDLAIASGKHLFIVHGRDRKLSFGANQFNHMPAAVEHRSFPFNIESLCVGDFISRGQTNVALLFADGSISMLSPGDANRVEAGFKIGTKQEPQRISSWSGREVFRLPTQDRASANAFILSAAYSAVSSDSLLVIRDNQVSVVRMLRNDIFSTGTDAAMKAGE